jgi:DNA mismatch repair ATPase MutS
VQEEKVVRKKLQAKYMLLETRKDGTKFTNRPMKEAAEKLQNLSGQYDDMQKQLVEQVGTKQRLCRACRMTAWSYCCMINVIQHT